MVSLFRIDEKQFQANKVAFHFVWLVYVFSSWFPNHSVGKDSHQMLGFWVNKHLEVLDIVPIILSKCLEDN